MEVLSAVKEAKQDTSPGEDNIRYIHLQAIQNKDPSYFTKVYNKILVDGTFPSEFKHAKCIPIRKPNRDHNTPKEYRPISLLPTTSKIFESILAKRISSEAKEIRAITPIQFEAISKHNAIDALLEIVEAAIKQ